MTPSCARGRSTERGFTLIELVVTSVMTLVVFSSLFGAMIAQQRSYELQLDASEASQNARAALAILRSELRMAGWGMGSSTLATYPAVGKCNNAASLNRFECNNVADFGDGTRNSDRLRVVSMRPDYFNRNAQWTAPGTIRTFIQSEFLPDEAPQMPTGALAIVNGECALTSQEYAAMTTVGTRYSSASHRHRYDLGAPPLAESYATLDSCGIGGANLETTVQVSVARVVDFYIDRNEAEPRLMMNVNPDGTLDASGAPSGAQVVAYNIDSLQITYGIDLGSGWDTAPSDIPDQEVDIWCNDITDSTDCNIASVTGTAFSVEELASRIVAVQLGVVTRANSQVHSVSSPGPDFAVFDTTIPGDQYRRWLFRGTVRLRNNEL